MSDQSGFISLAEQTSRFVNRIVSTACALIFGAMTLTVLVGVLFRYVFNSPLSWPEELSRYLMIWGATLAISIGIRDDEHVGLTVILDGLKSASLRRILSSIIFLLVMGFLVFMTFYAVGMTQEARMQLSQTLNISMFIPSLAVPASMGLAALQLMLVFIVRLARGQQPIRDVKSVDI